MNFLVTNRDVVDMKNGVLAEVPLLLAAVPEEGKDDDDCSPSEIRDRNTRKHAVRTHCRFRRWRRRNLQLVVVPMVSECRELLLIMY